MANSFVVDRKLGAVPVEKLLDVRAQIRIVGTVDTPITDALDRPVLAGGQDLQPNEFYPAEKNPSLQFYLPLYQIALDAQGQPQVELRYKAGDANEVGRLTLTLAWTPPAGRPGMHSMVFRESRVIDHVASLSLRYRVGMEGVSGAAAEGAREQTVPLQPLQQLGNQLARSTTIFTDKALFDTVYQAMGGERRSATLDIQLAARVGVRTWKQVIIGRPGITDQAKVLERRDVLFTEMVQKESLATMQRDAATGNARVKIVAPPPDEQASLDMARTAVARPEMVRMMAQPAGTPILRERTAVPRAAMMARPVTALRPAGTMAVDPAVSVVRSEPVEVASRISNDTLVRINAPALSEAVADSDLQIAGRKAVPVQVALDSTRRPAVLDTTLENRQSLPFAFDPAVNQSVFAVQGFEPGGIHLLLPLLLQSPEDPSKTYTVYQDNLMRDVVHVTPTEFRMERDPTPTYLPALNFVASQFSTTDKDNDGIADLMLRVTAIYRLEPWLDPDVLELARVELAKQGLVARFMTTVSQDAKLSLDLDLLGTEQQRNAAKIDPDTGITDTLDLDENTFLRLWRERLANPTGAITGLVTFRLFDGSMAPVRVRLSLWETSAQLFDVSFAGPVPEQPGRYRVRVRNRVESPVWIAALPGDLLAGGAAARPVDPQASTGQLLKPQETREIEYSVEPAATPVVDFTPTVIGRPEPDVAALLKKLLLTGGGGPLGFPLTVKAAQGTFGQAAGPDGPLTGLLVEFDDGTRVTLTPDVPQQDVTLIGRLIAHIQGKADESQRYFYRVTDLYANGDGARTNWQEGQGTATSGGQDAATLEVGSASARLDS